MALAETLRLPFRTSGAAALGTVMSNSGECRDDPGDSMDKVLLALLASELRVAGSAPRCDLGPDFEVSLELDKVARSPPLWGEEDDEALEVLRRADRVRSAPS